MIDEIIENALREDIGEGDHSSLSCVPKNATGTAKLLIKEEGVLAGVELAERIFKKFDPSLSMKTFMKDGYHVVPGDIVF